MQIFDQKPLDIFPKNTANTKAHIIAWLIFWLVDFGFLFAIRNGKTDINITEYISNVLFNIIFFYLVVFSNYKPLKSNNVTKIILFVVIILFGSLIIKFLYDIYLFQSPSSIKNFNDSKISYLGYELWRLVTMTIYAFAYLTYLKNIEQVRIIQDTERKLLVTEIAFLKAQINPHFLFNTLNFVYQDVCAMSPNSGDTILNLADMMRYSVRSTKMDFAPLINEVEAIDKYIYLQRKRFGEKMYVDFHKIGNLNNAQIPPLIMLSLVENAFKYGVYFEEENPIEIIVEVNENEIIFNCSNKIREDYKETETNAVGIGNIKRRLEIMYENNFELENWVENKNYFVHLKINKK